MTRIAGSNSTTGMVKSAAPDILKPANYEQALAAIRRQVAQMEGGQVPLDPLPQRCRAGAWLSGCSSSGLKAVEEGESRVREERHPVSWIVA